VYRPFVFDTSRSIDREFITNLTGDPTMTDRNGISISQSETGDSSRSKMVQWARLVAAVVIVIVLVAFVVDNSEHVRVGFVFFHADVALIWVLIVTAALGALADRLVPRLRARRAGSGQADGGSGDPGGRSPKR